MNEKYQPLSEEEITAQAEEFDRRAENVVALQGELNALVFRNASISLDPEEVFWGTASMSRVSERLRWERLGRAAQAPSCRAILDRYAAGERLHAYDGYADFGHVAPEWEDILGLGLWGLRERARALRASNPGKEAFYTAIEASYQGLFFLMERMAGEAERLCPENRPMREGLRHLTGAAPSSLLEAMQTMLIYYDAVMAEGTVCRTFGRLDQLLYPFYQRDIASGALDRAQAEGLIACFLKKLNGYRVPANIPFALCGKKDGKAVANELSYLILEAFLKLRAPYVKLHFLYAEDTPEDIVKMALNGIASGSNSIVFLSDRQVVSLLKKSGAGKRDAEEYSIVGCYEPCAKGETPCTCNGRVNLPMALEAALNGGKSFVTGEKIGLGEKGGFASFEELFAAYCRQLAYFCTASREMTDAYERLYPVAHGSPIFCSAMECSVTSGRDVYAQGGARYPNSSVNAFGLATAADSLFAIKRVVFEEKRMSLEELVNILREDFKGREELRLFLRHKLPKFGNGIGQVDQIAADILRAVSGCINGKPNAKGGRYRLGTFSIDWCYSFGETTGASADGRKAGDPLSKNLSPSLGADREGVTAQILSATSLPPVAPNGTVLDLVLHSSAVKGEEGAELMYILLKTWHRRGGFAVHGNVLDAALLKDAKRNPGQYPNLQVRLCGWNALFCQLPERVQDEFIWKAEKG